MRLPVVLALLLLPAAAFADDGGRAAPSPAEVGVRVEKPVGDGRLFSQGSGVFLGDGLVLTAAHVVDVDPGHSKVTVVLDGWRRDGTQVLDGQKEGIDLGLIALPPSELSGERRSQPSVGICPDNPPPNRPVAVASMGTVSMARTISTPITSDLQTTGTWTNLLSTGYHHGNSGGGVFDPGRNCLWGILNVELSGPSTTDGRFLDLTAFVPASKIGTFLGEYREQPPEAGR